MIRRHARAEDEERGTEELDTASATSSTTRRRGLALVVVGRASHASSSGAITRLPVASPSHHARQVSSTWAEVTTPPMYRLRVPTLALTAVLAIAASPTSATTSESRARRLAQAGRALDRPRADERLGRVARGDAAGDERGGASPQVGDECADEDARPELRAPPQECDQRDAGLVRHQRGEPADGVHEKAEPGGTHVQGGEANRSGDVNQGAPRGVR